ncbi:hypothetical protein GO755_40315 [Spirosoma sp. HMF4905]|uniref:Uncharacterized protein n=1 Tax=Spirosoma arboris TaxID=2682092 RepID=A0A7K1SR95_9BACT|nr:hypothetical protein [Spirosoma arboris]MVM36318.1 hypothetical protein [Spirosoma arboris]
MVRLFLIWLLLCLTAGPVFSQPKKIDSLLTVLAKHLQADTFRVNRLNDIAAVYFEKFPPDNPDRLDLIGQVSLQLASKLNYHYGQAIALGTLAGIASAKGDMKQYQK